MRSRSLETIAPSHPYHAGTEHVGFSPTGLTPTVSSAKRLEVFGESHEGWAASCTEPLPGVVVVVLTFNSCPKSRVRGPTKGAGALGRPEKTW